MNKKLKRQIKKLISSAPASNPATRVKYRGKTIAVVMPCWNEEGKIAPCLKKMDRSIVDTVVVVDNGSSDRTRLEGLESGAVVLSHPKNLGAGGGIRSGFFYALWNRFDIIILMAGDNQDNPEQIPLLCDPIIDGEADYVHGSRYAPGGKTFNMTRSRIFLTRFYSALFSFFFKTPVTDATNGFRAFRGEILKHPDIRLWQTWLQAYELEPYFLYKVIKNRFRFTERAVEKYYDPDMKKNTKMVPFKSWVSILRPVFILKFYDLFLPWRKI